MTTFDTERQIEQPHSGLPRDFLSVARHQKWIIVACILLSVVAAATYCLIATKLYRSETMILVEDQKIPENYVKGVDEGNLEQRIFVIQKQVRSRAVLTDIVNEFHLYPDLVKKEGPEAAVSALANGIMVEMVGKGPRGNFVGRSSLDAFTVSFIHESPRTAMEVTARVATRFIEQNLKTREQTAEGTTEFFDEEVLRAKAELERKENEISQFKSQHVGKLPQQIESNLRALDRLQGDLKSSTESSQRLSDRLALVENAIRDYQRSGTPNLSLVPGSVEPDPLFRRLKELREKLVKLQAEFWDTYPDVVLTRDEMQDVQRKLTELYGPDILKHGEKPVDPYLQDLRRQQTETKSEWELQNKRQLGLQTEKRELERRIEKAPQIEQDLLILERDYDNMKTNYRSLLEKRLNARVAENLEKRQKGAQFRILDPASFPRVPESPNERRIMVFGLLFGCALGAGLALIRELSTPQFRRPEDIEHILGPQLLAVIPDFAIEYNRLRWQRYFPTARSAAHVTPEQGAVVGDLALIPSAHLKPRSPQPWNDDFIVKWMPHSLVAEQYRVAATRLALQKGNGDSTIVAVTSAVKGEGKTTTVINLGYTLARDLGLRTLLLDCDFAVPMPDRYVDTVAKWGLADWLTSDIPLESCFSEFADVPCWVMPVGNSEVSINELLKTERLPSILAQLRERFDIILVNTPPIFPLATMNVLANYIDHMVLVVRANSTPHQVVRRALKSLGTRVPFQVLLNRVGSDALPSYVYGHSYTQAKVQST